MKIWLSSLSGMDRTESQHVRRVLRRLGHDVFWLSTPAAADDPDRGLWPEAGFAANTTVDAIVRASGFVPDLLLYIEPCGLIPRGVEAAPFPTACVLSDVHVSFEPRRRLAQFFDHVFLYHFNYLGRFQEHPATHVHWHPYACDLETFHPADGPRDLDVAFVGQIGLQSRREVIDRLSARWKMNERRQYLQREIGGVYGRSKIVLNLPLADDLNFRTFEAMSCGAMLLTSRVQNGQERLFEEGVHYASFSTLDEIPDRVAYYLEHDEERERIAAAGLAAIRQHHSLDLRLTQLLDAVARDPERLAPIRTMSAEARDRQFAWLYEYWRMVEPGLTLARDARRAGRSWWPLLVPVGRTVLRQLRSA